MGDNHFDYLRALTSPSAGEKRLPLQTTLCCAGCLVVSARAGRKALWVSVIAEFDGRIRGMAESIALLDASSRRSWLLVPSGHAESAAYYHTGSQKKM